MRSIKMTVVLSAILSAAILDVPHGEAADSDSR